MTLGVRTVAELPPGLNTGPLSLLLVFFVCACLLSFCSFNSPMCLGYSPIPPYVPPPNLLPLRMT